MKRILISLLPCVAICFLAWLGGYDFSERGVVAFNIGWFSIVIGAITYISQGGV